MACRCPPWLAVSFALCAATVAIGVGEYEAKAAFLFNFAKFCEWPPTAFSDPSSPIVICVYGPDPFGGQLDALVAREKVDEHPLLVRSISAHTTATSCHVLFSAAPETAEEAALLAAVERLPVLTVGDAPGFLERGGIIALGVEDRRIHFDVDLAAAERSSLVLSSKLLHLARSVRPAGAGP